jgi:hypothetical protein
MPSNTTRSGDPRKRTTTKPAARASASPDDKYAPQAWGATGLYEDLTFPSGQLALVRRPGLQGLMTAGVLHQMDTLTPLIQQHKDKANGKKSSKAAEQQLMQQILGDEKKLEELMHLLDRVTVHCVVKPEIEMTPNDVTSRVPGVIYADMVDLEDKLFLFNYAVGGSRDLQRFRGESEALVGGLQSVEEDEAEAV